MKKERSKITVELDISSVKKAELMDLSPSILLRRVSDISQSDGYSLPAQEKYGKEYIEKKKLTLVTPRFLES